MEVAHQKFRVTEAYDGTSWSTRPSLGTKRSEAGRSTGTSTAADTYGGRTPSHHQ